MDIVRKFTVLFVLGFFFGCISVLDSDLAPGPGPAQETCRTITVQEPYIEEVCEDVVVLEDVCKTIDLDYSLSQVNKTQLCVEKALCVSWYSNGTCMVSYCSRGMTRCQATLTNLDPQKEGTFGVSAAFTLGTSVFQKNEILRKILPNDSATYDFNQFYTMDINQAVPVCDVFVTSGARLQDCKTESRVFTECANVTKYLEVEKEICN